MQQTAALPPQGFWTAPGEVFPCVDANWLEKEFREAIVNESVDHTIAYQIRVNREKRGWTQGQFAKLIGTGQSAVARMEDPMYGSCSVATLKKIAGVFDSGLLVRFVSHDAVAVWMDHVSPSDLYVCPFTDAQSQNIISHPKLEAKDA